MNVCATGKFRERVETFKLLCVYNTAHRLAIWSDVCVMVEYGLLMYGSVER